MKNCIGEKCEFYLFDEAAYNGCMYGSSKDDYSVIAPCMDVLEDDVAARRTANEMN